MKQITWSSKLVQVSKIKPTPTNYKIKTDLGKERLALSLKKFGLAGTVVLNTDFTLIDGNSRLEEAKKAKQKTIWASVPNRKLTEKEFKEMSAMFDYAKAGEVDIDRINADLGTTEEFYKEWGVQVPMHLLEKMGKNQPPDVVSLKEAKNKDAVEGVKIPVKEIEYKIELYFTEKEEKIFRKMEYALAEKFKTVNTSMTVFQALKKLADEVHGWKVENS